MDGLNRAVLSAGTAAGAVDVHYAYILIEYYTARLGMTFLLYCERTDGSGRANLAADGATVVAVAFIKLHYGLHQATYSIFQSRGLKYVAGAFAYAQMACGTVLQKVFVADGTGR